MTPVRLEPAALRSRVKHSTTEPLRFSGTGWDSLFTIGLLLHRHLIRGKCYDCFEFIILWLHCIPRCTCKLINWKHWLYFKLWLQVYYFLERVAHRFYFPCVLLVLCLFVVLVSRWILASSFEWLSILLQGQGFVQITSFPDHCNFWYDQTLFAIILVYIFNKFCICSFMLNNLWSFHDVFSKLVPQSSIKWKFNLGISYPLSDLIVLDET